MRRDGGLPTTDEAQLKNGRWLRISHSSTRDGDFIVVCSDISLLKEQKADLRRTNLCLDAALDSMSQGLCLFDERNILSVVNRRFFEIFGLPRDEVRPGTSFREVLELSVACGNHNGKTTDQLLIEHSEFMSHCKVGTHYYEFGDGRTIAGVLNPTREGGWVATYEDVTERLRAEAKIMHMARHDALTNLPNRLLFRERMEASLKQGERLAVLFLDLDRFKSINDTLGHPVGDALLCEVTKRLQLAVGEVDTIARLGGDEFIIVQVGARPADAGNLASRIIESLSAPFDVSGHQVVIGTSIGIAIAPVDGDDPDQLLRNADMALYRAKADGRCTYHFFQREMDEQMQARHRTEVDLRKALLANEFELYYQPFVDLASGRVCGFEALVRWNHPERGLIAPDDFVPIAEEVGLIVPLGDWVLKQACREAAKWPDRLTVAVNLSAVQFRYPTLSLSVAAALGASGLDAARLELEITESVLLQDDRAVLNTLHEIRRLGVHIVMDDFGTGYSSLSYLRSFPFDKIKIDRSFTRELGTVEDSIAIVRAVVRLGSDFRITTVAEGVETSQQLAMLQTEGCAQAQGYLFSPPRPAMEIPAILAKLQSLVCAA